MAVTMKDIAEKAGVSISTVSRVISGKNCIREETSRMVWKAAEDLGFVEKTRKPRAGKTRMRFAGRKVGIVVPDIRNVHYCEIVLNIQQLLFQEGIETVICNTDENAKMELYYLNILHDLCVDGLIIAPVFSAAKENIEMISRMNQSGTPVVLIDRELWGNNFDGVFMNNYQGTYQSIVKFLENGHRNIAMLMETCVTTAGEDKLAGYNDALLRMNVPVREDLIISSDFTFDNAYQKTIKLLETSPEITAVFAANSRLSSGCLLALAEKRLVVGEDIAFIACGKIDMFMDRISYLSYPIEDIGKQCAYLLLTRMNGEENFGHARKIVYDMKLNLRGSEVFPKNREPAAD